MALNMLKFTAKSLLLVFFTSSSWAQTVPEITHGDWKSVTIKDPQTQRVTCQTRTQVMQIVSTNPASITPLNGEFSLTFFKDFKDLPKLTLKLQANPARANVILVKLNSKESHLMFLINAATDPAGFDLYQSAPLQLSTYLEVIREQSTLTVFLDAKIATPVSALKISLKGSSASLDEMQSCMGKDELLPIEFLKALNQVVDISQVQLAEQTPKAMINEVETAYSATLSAGVDNLALTQLRKKFSKIIDDEVTAKAVLSKAQKNVDDLNLILTQKQQKLTDAKNEAAQIASGRPALLQNIEDLKNIEANKLATYEPVKKQLEPLDAEVHKQESREEDATSDLSRARNDVSQAESELATLQSRSRSAQSEKSNYESRESSLKSDFDRADWDFRFFDVRRYRQDILSRDSHYRSAISTKQQAQSQLPGAQSDLSSAQSQLSSIQSQLNSCKATTGADCSALESQWNNQARLVEQKTREVQNLQNQINYANNVISNQERQADWAAQSKYDELRRTRDNLEGELRNTRAKISDLESELRRISSDIPRTEDEIRSAQSRVRDAQGYLRDARNKLADAEQKREALRAQLDYTRIRGEYLTAKADRQNAEKNLITTDARAKELTTLIPRYEADVKTAQARYEASLAPRDSAKAKLDAISTQLVGFRQDETALLAKINASKLLFEQSRARYQALFVVLKSI